MSILSRVKAASWPVAALSLVSLALAGVSAAPGGHSASRTPLESDARPAAIPAGAAACSADGSPDAEIGPTFSDVYRARYQELAFPYGQVDSAAYARGIAQRQQIAAASRKGASAAALSNRWEFIGPTNLTPPTRINFGQGFVSGRVNGISYDPNVTSNYWLASASGGVWKSSNSGQSWSFQSQSWPSLETSCVAVHPTDSNTVYAGTGDFQGFGGFYSFGIMKTTDGGATWTNQGKTQFGNVAVSDIIIDPESPQTVIAATGRGRNSTRGQVWRSTNGGGTWTAVITTQADWSGLAVGARNTSGVRRLWAVGAAAGGQVQTSVDHGATWTAVTTPLTAGQQDGLDIAASTTNPDTAYLLSGTDRKIFRTTNAGANWTDITAGFPNDRTAGDNYNWSQSNYDFHITTSQNSGQDVVYVGLRDLVISTDGGATWRSAGQAYTTNAVTHDDQHCVAVNPRNGSEVLVGNDGGIYRMIYNPAGNSVSFTSLNGLLGITQLNAADYHPSDPTRLLTGSQNNGTPAALGDLTHWTGVGNTGGGGCVINPSTPAIQFAVGDGMSVFRTADEWATTPATITPASWGTDRLPAIGRLAMDPSRTNLIYTGTNYLWRWDDTTQHWTPRVGGTDLAPGGGTVRAIAVAPSDGNVIYTGSTTGELFLTTNGGASWAQINTGSPALPVRAITSISVHPTNPFHIIVGLSGTGTSHVWRCSDTSQLSRAWTDVSAGLPDLPVNSLILDRNAPTTRYFAGTDAGVFRTGNGGTSWEDISTPLNLPNVIVNDVRLASTGYLMAATYGRGVWRIDPAAAATKLILRRPNGGEVLIEGQPTSILWDTGGFSAGHTVKLELSRDSGATFPEVIAASAPDTGAFIWTPQLPVSNTCRIRITSNTDSSVTDISDADFSIVQGSLTVIAPNGGEVVRFGQHVTVRWQATSLALTSQTVKIELSRDGGQTFPEVLADAVSTVDGQFDWTVSAPVTTTARIRVTAVDLPIFTDISDADFEIRQPSVITLQKPNSGEVLVAGTEAQILWSSAGFSGNVRIDISRNGGQTWDVLFPDTPNDGIESWTVTGPAAKFGRIRVTSVAEPNVSDFSDGVFAITAATLSVTGPAANGTVLNGGTATATWTSTGLAPNSSVRVELSRDGGDTWNTLSSATLNSGSFTFSVEGTTSNNARIRVTSLTADPAVSAIGPRFSIVDPTLHLITPNGGEKWAIGDQQIVEWSGTTLGVGTVTIELSRNGGKRWETVVEDTANDGGQVWGVRGKLTNKARIRITWFGDGVTQVAESGRNFKIVKAPKRKR